MAYVYVVYMCLYVGRIIHTYLHIAEAKEGHWLACLIAFDRIPLR